MGIMRNNTYGIQSSSDTLNTFQGVVLITNNNRQLPTTSRQLSTTSRQLPTTKQNVNIFSIFLQLEPKYIRLSLK